MIESDTVRTASRQRAGAAREAAGEAGVRRSPPPLGRCRAVDSWSPDHLAALAATVLGAVLLTAGDRRLGGDWPVARRALAAFLLIGFAGEQVTYALRGSWS